MVSASVPTILEVNGQFEMKDDEFDKTSAYIEAQRTSLVGKSFQSTEKAFSNQLSLGAKGHAGLDPATGGAIPVLPPAEDTDFSKLSLPPLNINNLLSAPGSPGDLLPKLGTINGISNRAAVLLGVNDKITERILRQMANPQKKDFVNSDYSVYFAIVQVSCNPGWRTRENYIADLTATCEYYNSTTRLSNEERPWETSVEESPLVFSVLPLLDAQNLELGNSDRSVTALAAQLSASYPTIGVSLLGQDLITFVKRHQKESVTRTPVTVTNSYSNGRNFGFRFAPSFTAQADPAYRKSRAANILNAVSFPVLVTVVTKPSIFEKRKVDSVRVNISTRWLIKDRPALPVWYKRLYTPLRRETQEQRISVARDVGRLSALLDVYSKMRTRSYEGNVVDEYSEFQLLRSDAMELIAKCGPQSAIIRVKTDKDAPGAPPPLCIGTPTPRVVPDFASFTLQVAGTGFKGVSKVVVGGKEAATVRVLGADMLLAAFPEGPIMSQDGKASLVVANDVTAVQATVGVAAAPAPTGDSVGIQIKRDAAGNILQVQIDRQMFPGLTDRDILEALTRPLGAKAESGRKKADPLPLNTDVPLPEN